MQKTLIILTRIDTEERNTLNEFNQNAELLSVLCFSEFYLSIDKLHVPCSLGQQCLVYNYLHFD